MSQLVKKIRSEMPRRPKVWRNIAEFVIVEEEKMLSLKLRDVSLGAGVSEGSVINFVRSLGYPGFVEFKVALAQSRGEVNSSYAASEGDNSLSAVLNSARDALGDAAKLDLALLNNLAERLLVSRMAVIVGRETSHYIAEILAGYLCRIGVAAFAAQEPCSVARTLSSEDTLIAISYSGETEDVFRAAGFAKDRGAYVAAITSFPNSSISSLSDLSLSTKLREAEEGEFPLVARIVELAIIDALCSTVISIKNKK
jgi:DNA-binding MurR/RpiR family transcriptional regulator